MLSSCLIILINDESAFNLDRNSSPALLKNPFFSKVKSLSFFKTADNSPLAIGLSFSTLAFTTMEVINDFLEAFNLLLDSSILEISFCKDSISLLILATEALDSFSNLKYFSFMVSLDNSSVSS